MLRVLTWLPSQTIAMPQGAAMHSLNSLLLYTIILTIFIKILCQSPLAVFFVLTVWNKQTKHCKTQKKLPNWTVYKYNLKIKEEPYSLAAAKWFTLIIAKLRTNETAFGLRTNFYIVWLHCFFIKLFFKLKTW